MRPVVVALVLVAAACSSGEDRGGLFERTTTTPAPTTTASGTAAPGFEPAPVDWTPCGDGLECGTLAVPVDHDAPTGRTIDLQLARRAARDPDARIGALLVNPGGPGASGIDFIRHGRPFQSEIGDRFDIVSWDPRGVGTSAGLNCPDDLVQAFQALDTDPDTTDEQHALEDAARDIAEECTGDRDLVANMSTVDAARDIDLIRRALGEQTITYYGFSYGTLLGLRYLDLFPTGARAVVLDGVVDPTDDFRAFLLAQTEAFEQAIEEVFAACDHDDDCPAGGAASAYDAIAVQVEVDPLPASGSRQLGPGDLATAAIYVTYLDALWPQFYDALAAGLDGDGEALYDLAESYRSFGGFASYVAVECMDSTHPQGSAEYQAFAVELEGVSPRFGATIANELLPCAFWPLPPAASPAAVTAPGSPPVLVIGNTGDAATPYHQAQSVAEMLDQGVLLTFEGEGHTSYGASACVSDVVHAYLVDLALPDPGTVC